MINIFKAKKVYLIGIKGVGMTALAEILQSLKIEVVGSDTKEKFFTDEVLKIRKIKYYEDFKEKNLKKELPVDLVISSVAYLAGSIPNPEIELAKKLNLPLISYSQALAQIFNQSFGIAICGSHGKSSTTAILGKVLQEAKLQPTVLVGSEVIEWKSNALVDKNFKKKINFLRKNEEKLKNLNWVRKNLKKLPIFIIEADEYREAFLNYFPRVIIITNIDYDHPDYFKTKKDYENAFKKFVKNLKEPKILIRSSKVKIRPFPFPLSGIHWQKNLNLVYKLIKILKIPEKIFLKSIKNYSGIKRRFEIVYHQNDLYFIDDYAHHPNEVLSFYKSLKEKFPDHKKILIFQPHTFTRTHFLFEEFKKIFNQIKKDKNSSLIIFKTFPSAREKEIILKIKKLKKEKDLARVSGLSYFEDERNLLNFLKTKLKNVRISSRESSHKLSSREFATKNKEKTIIATIGAGDIYKILEKLKYN